MVGAINLGFLNMPLYASDWATVMTGAVLFTVTSANDLLPSFLISLVLPTTSSGLYGMPRRGEVSEFTTDNYGKSSTPSLFVSLEGRSASRRAFLTWALILFAVQFTDNDGRIYIWIDGVQFNVLQNYGI